MKHGPTSSIQTMAPTIPVTHRLASAAQASSSSNYKADFSKLKEDLANIIKIKLGVDMGNCRLYQKSYSTEFDFVSYPTS